METFLPLLIILFLVILPLLARRRRAAAIKEFLKRKSKIRRTTK